ncbi:hypothetical protein [Pseudomonas amygdali]|nr:hypothetical protein [Pseudomonas amygdali]
MSKAVMRAARTKQPKIYCTDSTTAGMVSLLCRFNEADLLKGVIRKCFKLVV